MGIGCSRLPIAGGNWRNTSNAGVFYLNLNNTRSNSNSNIGFRSALPSYAGSVRGPWTPRQCEGIKESISAPGYGRKIAGRNKRGKHNGRLALREDRGPKRDMEAASSVCESCNT